MKHEPKRGQKQKMATGPSEKGVKYDGPINQHKMLAMGCPIPDERTKSPGYHKK